eukprot:1023878-Alexandrium_andersonii.AAC.1
MSASLVGSEMCIRDRRYIGGNDGRGDARHGKSIASEAVDRGLAGVGLGAVSYTHLTLPTICSV